MSETSLSLSSLPEAKNSNPRIGKIRQLLQKSDWKKAYKEAGFAFRLKPSPELREYLEFSAWKWLNHLIEKSMWSQAKELAGEILQLEIKNPEIQEAMPDVFAKLDMNDRLPEHLKKDMSGVEMQAALADQYLVTSQISRDLDVDLRKECDNVRTALELLEKGNDEEANKLLKSISFGSPLADWRMLVKGLLSYYGDDFEGAKAAWKRLNPDRAPARIANSLLPINSETENIENRPQLYDFYARTAPFRATALQEDGYVIALDLRKSLEQIRRYLSEKHEKEMVGRWNAIKERLRKISPSLFAKFQRFLWNYLHTRGEMDVLRHFVSTNVPLPFDPSGNRTYALAVLSASREDEKFPSWAKHPADYWEAYAKFDIDKIASLTPEMKNRAKAIVYGSVIFNLIEEYKMNISESPPYSDPDFLKEWNSMMAKMSQAARDRLESMIQDSLKADPKYVKTYRLELDYLDMISGAPRRKCAVLEELLEHVQDDEDALYKLIDLYFALDTPAEAEKYVLRLRELHPLDRKTARISRKYYCELACTYIANEDWKAARKTLDQCDAIASSSLSHFRELRPLALRFIVDYYSGETKKPKRGKKTKSIEQTDSGVDFKEIYTRVFGDRCEKETGPLMLIIAEAERLKLKPKSKLDELYKLWKSQLSGRCNGNAAGILGSVAFALYDSKLGYRINLDQAIEFTARASSVKWKSEMDIFGACIALHLELARQSGDRDYGRRLDKLGRECCSTFCKLAKTYVKQYPLSPLAHFFMGESLICESCRGLRSNRYLSYSWNSEKILETYKKSRDLLTAHQNDPDYEFLKGILGKRIAALESKPGFGDGPFGGYYDEEDDGDDEYDDDVEEIDGEKVAEVMEKVFSSGNGGPEEMMFTLFQSLLPDVLKPHAKFVLTESARYGVLDPQQIYGLSEKMEEFAQTRKNGIEESEIVEFIKTFIGHSRNKNR